MNQEKAPEFFAPSSLPLLMLCCLRSHSHHWRALLNLKRVVSPPSPTPPLSLDPHLSPSELLQFRVQGEVGQRQSQSLSLSATPSPAISDQTGWEGVVQCSRSGGSSLLPAGEGRLLLPRPGHTHSREIAGLQRSGSDDWTWPSLVRGFPPPSLSPRPQVCHDERGMYVAKKSDFPKMSFFHLPYLVAK